jgi:D-hydroxyproline dehydrogenase subunit gamma
MSSPSQTSLPAARMVRLDETQRAEIRFRLDGREVTALQGDTLLTAMLMHGDYVRRSEFGNEKRAGFCLMGACQDCWVWNTAGQRLRACATQVEAGMDVTTNTLELTWPNLA